MIIPEHVALILDGNGKRARKRGLPRTMGHREGCVTVEGAIETAARVGIRYFTVYGFSTENRKRSEEEVEVLMQFFGCYMVCLLKIATIDNARVRMIGNRTGFDSDIIEGVNHLKDQTKGNIELISVIAANYEGRDETRRAAARLAQNRMAGKADASRIDGAVIASYLDTVDVPDPDLLIRTSGELRPPNYLLWQLTYTEIAVTDRLWSDFDQEELEEAIIQYNKRNRWFGAVK